MTLSTYRVQLTRAEDKTMADEQIELCPCCKKRRLWTRSELEWRICIPCEDEAVERVNETREWEHYHPR